MAAIVQNRHYLAAAPCQSGVVSLLSLMYSAQLSFATLLRRHWHDALKLKAIVMSCCRFSGRLVKLIPPYARTQQG
jgi:hypothetical protein